MDKNIIIEITLGLGDVVFIEPAMRYLRSLGYEIILFVRDDALPLFDTYPVKAYSKNQRDIFKSCMANDPYYVLLDHQVHPASIPETRYRYFAKYICRALKIPYSENSLQPPAFPVTLKNKTKMERLYRRGDHKSYIYWQINSSRKWKDLDIETAKQSIFDLANDNMVYVTAKAWDMATHPNIKRLTRMDTGQFRDFLSVMDKAVTMDSFPGWLAAAVGTETIMLFGPTDYRRYAIGIDKIIPLQSPYSDICDPCEVGCDKLSCMRAFDKDSLIGIIKYKTPMSQEMPKLERIGKHYIALLRLDGLGGTLTLAGQAKKVKEKYPDYKVLLIIRDYPELFEDNPYVDDIILTGMANWDRVLEKYKDKFAALADIRFAVGKWYGFPAQWQDFALYQKYYDSFPLYQGELDSMGFHHIQVTDKILGLPYDAIESKIYFKRSDRKIEGDYIVIVNGVDTVHKGKRQTKCWNGWRGLVNIMDRRCVQVGTVYDPKIIGAEDYRGQTNLKELCSILEHSKAIIVTEGGLMHLAYALECKNVFVLRGPTASKLLEYPGQHYIDSYACSNCMFTKDDWYYNCPLMDRPICMDSITPERVKAIYENLVTD